MTNRKTYEQAYAAHQSAPDDAEENVPFYRTWAGMKAVLALHGYDDPFTAPLDLHSICCWAQQDHQSQSYGAILCVLDMCAPKEPAPLKHVRCFYRSEPTPPTEADARKVFEESYRAKWPGKRINTKHAKEKWEQVKALAAVVAQQRYEEEKRKYDLALGQHNAAEKAEEDQHAAKMAAYRKSLELIAKLKEA